MKTYGRTMDSYEIAMRVSDFNTACRYVDPHVMGREDCMRRYQNMKVTSYDILSAKLADDKSRMNLTVEVAYFFLDRYIVKKKQFEQVWHYEEDSKRWVLRTGPPHFE